MSRDNASLQKIHREVETIKSQLKDSPRINDIERIQEMLTLLTCRVNDLGSKLDFIINEEGKGVINTKESKREKTPKQSNNVMIFFKNTFLENRKLLEDVVSNEDIERTREENKSVIEKKSKKSNPEKVLADIIYKSFILNSTDKKNAIRHIMDKYNEEKDEEDEINV
jgi:hypothetical protein